MNLDINSKRDVHPFTYRYTSHLTLVVEEKIPPKITYFMS